VTDEELWELFRGHNVVEAFDIRDREWQRGRLIHLAIDVDEDRALGGIVWLEDGRQVQCPPDWIRRPQPRAEP
jgi:hypothetical protein